MPKGGKREGAGRKPKADEEKLIEKLDEHINSDEVFIKMNEMIKDGDTRALTLYLNYRYGKPKENISQTHTFNDFKIEDVIKFRD